MGPKIYAVGDVHGRLDLLERALGLIENEAGAAPADIVFLGDYIDRGPDSCGVLERLIAGPRREGDRWRCLMGNHEALAVSAYAAGKGSAAAALWIANGGDATLRSCEHGALPASHLAWMARLPRLIVDEHRIFVHAGLRPGVPIERQDPEDLVWIRGDFLRADHDFGRHVVHGHTPDEHGPDLRRFRTNLDTGAVWSGRLAVGVFDAARPGGPVATHIVTRDTHLAPGGRRV